MPANTSTLSVRPYQLLCAICSLGGPLPQDARTGPVERLRAAVRANPDIPVTLVCNSGDLFAWQDPDTAEDTPEGEDYNRKRDLDILQRMGWTPGITLPARVLFRSLFPLPRRPTPIPTVDGLCGHGSKDPGWEGCPKARSGDFERALQQGVAALIPPRADEEMAAEKAASVKAMETADEIRLRPHLLLCAVCQYAGGMRPPFKPDNLPELLHMILTEKPDVPIRFVRQADWLMCAPCPHRVPVLNACANVQGAGGLSNEKRDLDVLQQLGLHFGDVRKAGDLYRLIFRRVGTTMATCPRPGNPPTSPWWDRSCGESDPAARHRLYEDGRDELANRF